ncbi:hypothetical protein HZC34_01565 [Candidatus Saganbacteria bacterium]|nr:hypothetical protein [Candidatus Saganbacteria bacterium]
MIIAQRIGRTGLKLALAALMHLPAIGFVSCGPQGATSVSLTKVHSQIGWADPKSPNFHGEYLKTTDFNLLSCASCHGADLRGKKDVVSCFSCHDFPHAKDFEKLHKVEILKNNGVAQCIKCHEDLKEVKDGKPGCRSCHDGGTFGFTDHSSIEEVIGSHGDQAKTRGTKPCQTCHALGDTEKPQTVFFDADGKERNPNLCTECHTAPIQVGTLMHWGIANWKLTSKTDSGSHPDYLFTNKCTPCHGKYPALAGKTQGDVQVIKGCSSCHAGFYGKFEHKDPLEKHKAHLTDGASELGVSRLDVAGKRCVKCHGFSNDKDVLDQYTGKQKTIPSCTKCHSNSHLQDDWTNADNGGKHRLDVGQNGFNACKQCHGDSFDGTAIIPGCATCHAEGNNFGKVPHNGNGWAEDSGHGLYVKANGTPRCETCHSIGDSNKKKTNWPDGTELPTCFKCHDGPTGKPASHVPAWAAYSPINPIMHSGFLLTKYYNPETWVMKLGADGGNCESCHFDKSKAWTTCTSCHAPYPVQHITYNPKWLSPGDKNFHGILHKDDFSSSCATFCHGTDLKGGSSQVDCTICHDIKPKP